MKKSQVSHERLKSHLDPKGTLLVFLRHLGCTFCRQMVSEIRQASETVANFPKVVLIHQGTTGEGQRFFSEYWPTPETELSIIADPELSLYQSLSVGRGSLLQLFGPRALIHGLKGLAHGHGIGKPMGDPMRMPGLFYVYGDEIVWSHRFRHAGDHPDFKRLPEAFSSLA